MEKFEKYTQIPARLHNFQSAFGLEKIIAEKNMITEDGRKITISLSCSTGQRPKEIIIYDEEDKIFAGIDLQRLIMENFNPAYLKVLTAVLRLYDEKTRDLRDPDRTVIVTPGEVLKEIKIKKNKGSYRVKDKLYVANVIKSACTFKINWYERPWEWDENKITKSGRKIKKGGHKSSTSKLVTTPLLIFKGSEKNLTKLEERLLDEGKIKPFSIPPDWISFGIGKLWWNCMYGDENRNVMLTPLNTEVFYKWHPVNQAHELLLQFYYSQMFRVNWQKYKGVIKQEVGTILKNVGIPLGIESDNYMRTYDKFKYANDDLGKVEVVKNWEIIEDVKCGKEVFKNTCIIQPPDEIIEYFSQSKLLNKSNKK